MSVRIPALALLALLTAGTAWAGAREDVKAASQKMLSLRSYHVTMRHTGNGPMTTEADFVAPDRFRMKMPMGTQVIVGDTMYMQMDGRTMKVPMPKGTLTQWRDPANLSRYESTMTVESLGTELLDGKPTKKYRVTNTQPQPSTSTMWIGGNGYPLQIRVDGKLQGQASTTTIRYSRFNDPTIRVDPPK